MKKIFLIIFILFLFLSSCSKSDTNTVYKLKDYSETAWVNDINYENVTKIRLEKGAFGVQPGTFCNVLYSENKDDIEYNLNVLNQDLEKNRIEIFDGGGYLNITFYTKSDEYNLKIDNSRYKIDSKYEFVFNDTFKINNPSANYDKFFESTYTLYDMNDNKIDSKTNLSLCEFYKDESFIFTHESFYRIQFNSFVSNIFIYEKDVLVIDGMAYKIVNNTFDDLSFEVVE